MFNLLVKFVRSINFMSLRLGKALSFGVFILIFILLFEAVARYALHHPTPWSIELAAFVFVTYTLLAGGYALSIDAHVRMDALYLRWSPKRRATVEAITFVLVAVYLIVFIWGGIESSLFAINFGQSTKSLWGPPLGPIKVLATIGAVLLLLQAVAFLIRDLAIIRGKEV